MNTNTSYKTLVYDKEFEIHNTPIEKVIIYSYSIQIEMDDVNEERFKISAKPYIAIRITKIDSVSSNDFYNDYSFRGGRYHRHILVVNDSKWLESLRHATSRANKDFLENRKHYVIPLQENIIEFIASDVKVEKCRDITGRG